jgi:hypothetical protein
MKQYVILHYKMREVQKRLDQAKASSLQTFQENHRLRLDITENIKNAYFRYVVIQSRRMRELKMELYGEASEDEFEEFDDSESYGDRP